MNFIHKIPIFFNWWLPYFQLTHCWRRWTPQDLWAFFHHSSSHTEPINDSTCKSLLSHCETFLRFHITFGTGLWENSFLHMLFSPKFAVDDKEAWLSTLEVNKEKIKHYILPSQYKLITCFDKGLGVGKMLFSRYNSIVLIEERSIPIQLHAQIENISSPN